MEHEIYMREAIKEAKIAYELGEIPIGAIIVKDGKVIGRGHNTRELSSNSLCHAEINAIEMACNTIDHWRLTGSVIYVTIEPCPMCSGAIFQSRIKSIVYGAKDSKSGACGSLFNLFEIHGLNHYCDIINGVLELECADLMKSFFKKLR